MVSFNSAYMYVLDTDQDTDDGLRVHLDLYRCQVCRMQKVRMIAIQDVGVKGRKGGLRITEGKVSLTLTRRARG